MEIARPVAVDWDAVDADIAAVAETARLAATATATELVRVWTGTLRLRLDNDFLPRHFRYWNRRTREFRGLGYAVMNTRPFEFVFGDQPSANEAMALDLEAEFSRLVIRPVLADHEIRAIAEATLGVWVSEVEAGLSGVPDRHSIRARDWSLFMRELAGVAAASGSDTVPLTLKTAYVGAGTFVVAGAVGARSVSALAVKPAAGAVAAGAKTGAKLGLKAWGPVIAVVVVCWEVWDHRRDVAANLPLLRRDLNAGLDAIANTILNCRATGLAGMIADLETRLRHGVDSGIARRK